MRGREYTRVVDLILNLLQHVGVLENLDNGLAVFVQLLETLQDCRALLGHG